MKKIAAIILAILMCITMSACSDKDSTPEGMQSATLSGEPFILYVPASWTLNTASGISSAYFAFNNVIVSARYVTPDSDISLDEYVTSVADGYAESFKDAFSLTEGAKSAVLGGENAKKIEYSLKKDSLDYTVTQYFVKYKGDVITLNIYAVKNIAENFKEDVESIVANFKLCEKTAVKNDCVTDKNTPEGMKIASSDKLEYRLYVPQSWICEAESGISEAYYPESQRTNVTLTSYSPNEKTSLEEYCDACIAQYENTISGFAVISRAEAEVLGREAISLEFSASYGEKVVKVRQVMLLGTQNELFYNFTYTAAEENYELHMADFEKILDSFTFR